MAFQGRAAYPQQGIGYSRGSMDASGSGSGMGNMAQGTASLGSGLGSISSIGGAWEPSVLYLVGLVIAEMIVFHVLGRVLSK